MSATTVTFAFCTLYVLDGRLTNVSTSLLAVSCVLSVLMFSYNATIVWSRALLDLVTYQTLCVAGAAVAYVVNELEVYALAFCTVHLIFIWINLYASGGGVLYDCTSATFVVTRSFAYASLRLSTKMLMRNGLVPKTLHNLAPAVCGWVETILMTSCGMSNSYSFSERDFETYVVLKFAVLVAVPILESTMLNDI